MRYFQTAILLLSMFGLSACSMMQLSDNLAKGVIDNQDPQLVADALPAYLITMDGLIANWPNKTALLRSGASLYSAYGSLFVEEAERQQMHTEKALVYAQRAACEEHKNFCDLRTLSVPKIEQRLTKAKEKHVPSLYTLGTVWASYVQVHSDDWKAVADLARVQTLLEKVVFLDEGYEHGQANLYLAVLDSLLPAALGGQPERAQQYFQKAITLSDEKNLYAKVMYAQTYARMAFDQELHDTLLNEVLSAEAQAPGLTLQNTFAKQEAKRLLAESSDYF